MRLRFRTAYSCLVLLIVISSTSCVFGDPGPRGVGVVGVKRSDGQLSIGVKTCKETARISNVTLETSGKPPKLLWAIDSESGSPSDSYVVGVTPPGFSERLPLVGVLRPDETYLISVDVQDEVLRPVVEFRPDRLSSETWLIDAGKTVSDAEFARLSGC